MDEIELDDIELEETALDIETVALVVGNGQSLW